MADKTQMDAYDWLYCGYEVTDRLPMKRLQIPLYGSVDEYYQTLHDLEGMILRAKEALRLAPSPRYATQDIIALVDNLNSRWDLRKKQMERRLFSGEEEEPDNVERLQHQTGT